MATNYPVNPRIRAYGKARIDLAQRMQSPQDWEELWLPSTHPFPFSWGESSKQCIEYAVDDFAAEVGFFIDVLGLGVTALDSGYAMFTSPQGDFFFSVVPAQHQGDSTPPNAIRLQFMLEDVTNTYHELEKRGIVFDQPPAPIHSGSLLYICSFRTPHGICVDLWGMLTPSESIEKDNLVLAQDESQEEKDAERDEEDDVEEDDDALTEEEEEPLGDESEAEEEESGDEEEEDELLLIGEAEDVDEDELLYPEEEEEDEEYFQFDEEEEGGLIIDDEDENDDED